LKFIPTLTITWWLCAYFLVTHAVEVCYAARGLETPVAFELLSSIGILWLIGWWLEDDGKKYGMKLIHDLGLFLAAGWMIILPYYLFKTRGAKGFITILLFVVVYVGTYLISLPVYFALL
jgi:hypothetical protein